MLHLPIGYHELSNRLNRTEGAIKRRISELGLKLRPVKADNHIKWKKEEIDLLVKMKNDGHCYQVIASKIGKSAMAARGKVERMILEGYIF